MGRNPISAENFTQLFSSLETLDVTHIVSTLLKIAPLRDEIRRQMRPLQPRVRRKRRTRAEMEALPKYGGEERFKIESEQFHSFGSNTQSRGDNLSLQSSNPQSIMKKRRKGTPAKLNNKKGLTSHLSQVDTSMHLETPLVGMLPQAQAAFSTTGVNSPVSSTSNISTESRINAGMTVMDPNIFQNTAELSKGVGMFNPINLHSFPYWNMLQMTANRLMYNYNNLLVPTFNAETKSANDMADCVTRSNHNQLQSASQSNSPHSVQETLDARVDEEEEETIDIVSDKDDALSEHEPLTSAPCRSSCEDACNGDMCDGKPDGELIVNNETSEELLSNNEASEEPISNTETSEEPISNTETSEEPTSNSETFDKSVVHKEARGELMINEMNVAQNSTIINCPDCGVSVILSSLTNHVQNQCSKTLSKRSEIPSSNLSTQKMSKIASNWESCSICFESVPGKKGMMRHMKQRHSIKKHPFICEICNERFRNKSMLKRHQITHTSGGGHACSYCAKIFAKPELLRRHELLHTEMRKMLWPCSKCNKSFSNKYNLAVHDRMHTGELPFPCPECPDKFRVKCSMQNHMKSRHPNAFLRCNSPSIESESPGL